MDAAQYALRQHSEAINARDIDAYRQTMNFPFTYQNYNGVALTMDQADDCGITAPLPWDIILSTDPEWHHTEFDTVEEVARSETSAVFKVGFRRIDNAGHGEGVYDAIWIVTCQHERWGVQFRHNLGRRTSST